MRTEPSFHMEFGSRMITVLHRVMNIIFIDTIFYRFQNACTDLIAYCLIHPDSSVRLSLVKPGIL